MDKNPEQQFVLGMSIFIYFDIFIHIKSRQLKCSFVFCFFFNFHLSTNISYVISENFNTVGKTDINESDNPK